MYKNTTRATKLFKIKLKKDDKVVVLAGKYKGKTGKVVATQPKDNTVTVEGINIIKKHIKANTKYPQGTILEITKPVHVGKVAIIDPETKKATRIGYVVKDGTKTRIYKSSSKEIK
jgi:large subunit ribosomal protein L24